MNARKILLLFILCLTIIFIFTGCTETVVTPEEGDESIDAVINYFGDLITYRAVRFDGYQSTNAEYYRWSYKESSQTDESYVVVDNNTEYSSTSLCFQKAVSYDIKLEIKENVTKVLTINISQNTTLSDTDKSYVKIHNNLDGTYSLSLTLSDQIHNIISDMTNKSIYFDFIGWDAFSNHATGKYCYYQYLIEGYTEDDVTYDPGFYLKDDPPANVIPFYQDTTPDNLPKELSLENSYTLAIENLEDVIYYDMLIIKRNSEGVAGPSYLKIYGRIALTDDTITDYYVQQDPS